MLNLPPAALRLRRGDGVLKVFDVLRKKYVVLTPEEYVRQNFVHWLIRSLHYPSSLMANEIGINLNGTRKRCDTVVFNTDGTPFVVVEYKSPDVTVTQSVFDQIVRYNMVLHARFLIVSNGLNHYCCMIDYKRSSYLFLSEVPDYHNANLIVSEEEGL
ncbi:MAG: type I restriction enzyme HsdR N-terminal domain-containing protein [Muribaculaceae bacterium]|nr:type I restriction enzyme HsdR N-terminal domain-containing protein [Muribaculaceae bacterium]